MTMKTKILLIALVLASGVMPATAQQAVIPTENAAAPVEAPRITKAECIQKMNAPATIYAPGWIIQLTPKDPSAAVLDRDNVKSTVKTKRQRQHAQFFNFVHSQIAAGDKGKLNKPYPLVTITPREFVALLASPGEWGEQMTKWAKAPADSPGVISHKAREVMESVVAYAATPAGQAEDAEEKAFAAEVGKALDAYRAFLARSASAQDHETLRLFAEGIKR